MVIWSRRLTRPQETRHAPAAFEGASILRKNLSASLAEAILRQNGRDPAGCLAGRRWKEEMQ
jgi:hypothetical protein